jgi:two-component system sensor histidine kinase KdpD
LRTPLAAIAASSSGLRDERMFHQQSLRELLLREIDIASERLNRLVENLLDMSRLESGHLKAKLEWCEIADIVNVTLSQIHDGQQRARVKVHDLSKLPLIYCDFVLSEQCLTNLIQNALMYSGSAQTVLISGRVHAGYVEIWVEDSGPGISKEDLPRIFEKFYRSKSSPTGGTGLGLSIVKGFMESQGASVLVENRETKGARFILQFDLKPQPKISEVDHV